MWFCSLSAQCSYYKYRGKLDPAPYREVPKEHVILAVELDKQTGLKPLLGRSCRGLSD
jgi:hypothetical protein